MLFDDTRKKLEKRFNRLYKNCELYHITVCGCCSDGYISASVFYKDSNGKRFIDCLDTRRKEATYTDYLDEGGNIESLNQDRAYTLFAYCGNIFNSRFVYNTKPWVD